VETTTPTPLTFSAGQHDKAIDVRTFADTTPSRNETLVLRVYASGGGRVLAQGTERSSTRRSSSRPHISSRRLLASGGTADLVGVTGSIWTRPATRVVRSCCSPSFATILVVAIDNLRFAYQNEVLKVALETASALIGALGCYLVAGRPSHPQSSRRCARRLRPRRPRVQQRPPGVVATLGRHSWHRVADRDLGRHSSYRWSVRWHSPSLHRTWDSAVEVSGRS